MILWAISSSHKIVSIYNELCNKTIRQKNGLPHQRKPIFVYTLKYQSIILLYLCTNSIVCFAIANDYQLTINHHFLEANHIFG